MARRRWRPRASLRDRPIDRALGAVQFAVDPALSTLLERVRLGCRCAPALLVALQRVLAARAQIGAVNALARVNRRRAVLCRIDAAVDPHLRRRALLARHADALRLVPRGHPALAALPVLVRRAQRARCGAKSCSVCDSVCVRGREVRRAACRVVWGRRVADMQANACAVGTALKKGRVTQWRGGMLQPPPLQLYPLPSATISADAFEAAASA